MFFRRLRSIFTAATFCWKAYCAVREVLEAVSVARLAVLAPL